MKGFVVYLLLLVFEVVYNLLRYCVFFNVVIIVLLFLSKLFVINLIKVFKVLRWLCVNNFLYFDIFLDWYDLL